VTRQNHQGVRDLSGPRGDGHQTNQLPPQRRGADTHFCRHVDVRHVDGSAYPWFECRTCGALWEDDGFGHPLPSS